MDTKTSAHKRIKALRSFHPKVHIHQIFQWSRWVCGLPIFHRRSPIRMSRSMITGRAPHAPAITSELLLIFVLIVNQCPLNFSHLSSISYPSTFNLMQRGASHIWSPSRRHASSALRQTRRASHCQDRPPLP
jgi:hypothetical protein